MSPYSSLSSFFKPSQQNIGIPIVVSECSYSVSQHDLGENESQSSCIHAVETV